MQKSGVCMLCRSCSNRKSLCNGFCHGVRFCLNINTTVLLYLVYRQQYTHYISISISIHSVKDDNCIDTAFNTNRFIGVLALNQHIDINAYACSE